MPKVYDSANTAIAVPRRRPGRPRKEESAVDLIELVPRIPANANPDDYWSSERFMEVYGCDRQTVSRWINGIWKPYEGRIWVKESKFRRIYHPGYLAWKALREDERVKDEAIA